MDFLILKVNGLDVSDCSHDEAVKILSAASEPITVEVKHRNSAAAKDDNDKVSDDNGGLKVSSKCSREIQTDPAEEVINNVCDQCGDLYNSYFNYNCDIQLDPEDSFIYPELQYEEIELKRPANNPSELLGLTLCYEDEDADGNTEIFIDDIHPSGLAARDGRLRLGDQIIQINGERVRSKSRAQELFRSMRGDVSLLVVRPPQDAGPGYEDDLDNLLDLSQSLHTQGDDYKAILNKNRLSSTSSKDSGHNSGSIDRTSTGSSQSSSSREDANFKSKEDLYPAAKEIQQPPIRVSPSLIKSAPIKNISTGDCIYSTDSEFYYVDGKLKEIDDFYREVKNAERLKENNKVNSSVAHPPVVIDPVYEIIPECSDADELYCLPQDSKPVIVTNNNKFKMKPQEKIKSICRSISSPLKMNEFLQSSSSNNQQSKVKRSTSSYRHNTAADVNIGSWLRPADIQPAAVVQKHNNNNAAVKTPQNGSPSSLILQGSSLTLVSNNSGTGKLAPSSDIVYTNINNLERTMRDQQEKLMCQINNQGHQRPQFVAPPPPSHPPPAASNTINSSVIQHEQSTSFMTPSSGGQAESDQHWEWRIKVRPDGSRYIARRPTRTFLLRQREKQIAEERGGGCTTDDDTASEVKVGKFWTRDQRKKHLEDSKERRKRQEELIKSKTSSNSQGNNNNNSPKRHSYHEPSSSTYNTSNEIVLTVATV